MMEGQPVNEREDMQGQPGDPLQNLQTSGVQPNPVDLTQPMLIPLQPVAFNEPKLSDAFAIVGRVFSNKIGGMRNDIRTVTSAIATTTAHVALQAREAPSRLANKVSDAIQDHKTRLMNGPAPVIIPNVIIALSPPKKPARDDKIVEQIMSKTLDEDVFGEGVVYTLPDEVLQPGDMNELKRNFKADNPEATRAINETINGDILDYLRALLMEGPYGEHAIIHLFLTVPPTFVSTMLREMRNKEINAVVATTLNPKLLKITQNDNIKESKLVVIYYNPKTKHLYVSPDRYKEITGAFLSIERNVPVNSASSTSTSTSSSSPLPNDSQQPSTNDLTRYLPRTLTKTRHITLVDPTSIKEQIIFDQSMIEYGRISHFFNSFQEGKYTVLTNSLGSHVYDLLMPGNSFLGVLHQFKNAEPMTNSVRLAMSNMIYGAPPTMAVKLDIPQLLSKPIRLLSSFAGKIGSLVGKTIGPDLAAAQLIRIVKIENLDYVPPAKGPGDVHLQGWWPVQIDFENIIIVRDGSIYATSQFASTVVNSAALMNLIKNDADTVGYDTYHPAAVAGMLMQSRLFADAPYNPIVPISAGTVLMADIIHARSISARSWSALGFHQGRPLEL